MVVKMARDVIIACDFNSKEEVMNFLDKFQDEKPFLKITLLERNTEEFAVYVGCRLAVIVDLI